jgi:hypothetical protein
MNLAMAGMIDQSPGRGRNHEKPDQPCGEKWRQNQGHRLPGREGLGHGCFAKGSHACNGVQRITVSEVPGRTPQTSGAAMGSRLVMQESRGIWSGWRDSNSRHLAPKASALPGCATPRTAQFYRNRRFTVKPNSACPSMPRRCAPFDLRFTPVSFIKPVLRSHGQFAMAEDLLHKKQFPPYHAKKGEEYMKRQAAHAFPRHPGVVEG